MAYIELWNGEKIDPETDKIMEETAGRWNRHPNIVKALALNKDILIGEDIWTDRVMKKGLLSRKFKESIATAVSATNKCLYCTTAHSWAMELTGTAKNLVDSCVVLKFDEFPDNERVVLEFTQKATTNSKSISQEDINKLRKYYSDSEIVEIAAVIMAYMGYNTFVEILGLNIDEWMDRDLETTWQIDSSKTL